MTRTRVQPKMIDPSGGSEGDGIQISGGEFVIAPVSGGSVDSVNGQTGVVVLDLNDINDVPPYPNDGNYWALVEKDGVLEWKLKADGNVNAVTSGTGIDVDNSDPSEPIVNLDASSIASLALADSALQTGDNISELTNDSGYITDVSNLSDIQDVPPYPNDGNDYVLVENNGDLTWEQRASTSPLTTKGDLYGYDTDNARIPVGADGEFLVADSSEALGVKWGSAASISKQSFVIPCSDETTDLATGTGLVEFQMPYDFTLTGVRATVTTAPTGSTLDVDINQNGGSILSTIITIDSGEKTSETAATPPVISIASLSDGDVITIDLDQIGSTIAGSGLKVYLIGYATNALVFSGQTLQLDAAYSDEGITDLVADTLTPVWSYYATKAFSLTDWKFNVITAPVGASITLDVHVNGSTIFSTKPTIASGANISSGAVLSTTVVALDDLIEVFVDTVGSTTAGNGLKGSAIGVLTV